jgi:nucleotide-binding universal stress UspA family protein
MTYGTIVVGTDGSSTAQEAVRHAGALASAEGARLVVVTAYTPHHDDVARRSAEAPDDIRWMLTDRSLAEEKAEQGRGLAVEAGATGVVVQATEGNPADVVLDAAKQFGADLIVVGSKGLTSASRYVLGAVASSVSHHAPCDVLVVHTTT